MVRFLERHGIDVTYISNVDVETRLPKLPKPKLFMSQGHDEYWSWKTRDNVEAWRDEGVNLAFLGSNTAYWQIRYEDMQHSEANVGSEPRTIVCYRRERGDPDKSKYRSVKWRQVRPEAEMVGLEYAFPGGDPFDADLIVADSTHWIFNQTGLEKGSKLSGLLGYEVDRIRNWYDGEPKIEVTKLFESELDSFVYFFAFLHRPSISYSIPSSSSCGRTDKQYNCCSWCHLYHAEKWVYCIFQCHYDVELGSG